MKVGGCESGVCIYFFVVVSGGGGLVLADR